MYLPAYLEIISAAGDPAFITFKEACQSPSLRRMLTERDKAIFRRAISRLRHAGRLYQVSYVGRG
jgi:hypothetical protein